MPDRSVWSASERPADLRRAARAVGAHLVGVVGFSGGWQHNPRPDAASAASAVLDWLFDACCAQHQPVWCVSGATDLGVPALAYRAAAARGLVCVGVTADAARAYPIAALDRLVVVGRRFGDESATFVSLCDEFWMIGGGAQSEAEMRSAGQQGKPVVLVRGLGGRAEHLTVDEIPTARLIVCDDTSL